MANKLNKSTGLFGMGGGRRKASGSNAAYNKSVRVKARNKRKEEREEAREDRKDIRSLSKKTKRNLIDKGMKRSIAKNVAKSSAPEMIKSQKDERMKRLKSKVALGRVKRSTIDAAKKGESKGSVVSSNTINNKSNSTSSNSERGNINKKAKFNAGPGGIYTRINADGTTSRVKNPSKAMHGAKVKAMKGSKVMYKNGGALKSVPSEAKGLSKLPTSVRNKMGYMKNGGKLKKKQAELDARAKKLQQDNKPKNPLLKTLKVPSSRRGEAVQAPEGIAEQATSGPRLMKYYMSKAGGGMSRDQASAKMVRAKLGKIPSDDGKSMVKMKHGGKVKAMYGAKMKKAMYGAKVIKKSKK